MSFTNSCEWQKEHPAKKITNDILKVREIILERIEKDFYNKEPLQKKVAEKLIHHLLNPSES